MKATAHWLTLKGYTPASPSHIFDEEFTHQIVQRGRIEDTEVLHKFLRKTGQPLMQDWLMAIAFAIGKRLPVKWGIKMAWQQVFKPKTRGWGKAKAALEDYIHEVEAEQKAAIHGKGAASQTRVPMREAAE
jgi:heterodisulfide reductase subunit C2